MSRIRHAVAVVATVAVASGCSLYDDLTTSEFAQQDGDAIVASASKAMAGIDSVRVTGQVRDKGEQYFVDMSLDREGSCTGTIRFGSSNVDIRSTSDKAWFKGEAGALNRLTGGDVPTSVLRRISTQWLALPARDAKDFCDFGGLLDSFQVVDVAGDGSGTTVGKKNKGGKKKADDLSSGDIPVIVGEETDIDGQKVVQLTGSPGGTHDEHIWVLTDAPHYVVKLESTATKDGGTLNFSEFDEDVEVAAPKPRDVFKG